LLAAGDRGRCPVSIPQSSRRELSLPTKLQPGAGAPTRQITCSSAKHRSTIVKPIAAQRSGSPGRISSVNIGEFAGGTQQRQQILGRERWQAEQHRR
jgi:hypothetical protein